MFKKDHDEPIPEKDWNLLRITAINTVDREIAMATSTTDFEWSDDDFSDISHRVWLMFYNSCVEYHIVSTIHPQKVNIILIDYYNFITIYLFL